MTPSVVSPIQVATHAACEEPAPDRDSDRPCTVLYVEDHPVNVLLMQALFCRRPELRLIVATSGEAGHEAAIAHTPDLLLLDLRLPDCHGTELLQRLRATPALSRVPAVAVTADDTTELHPSCFDEVWHKPMDMTLTLARLDRLLQADARRHSPKSIANPRPAACAAQAQGPSHAMLRRHRTPPLEND